ncbi:hypothetical protein H0H81_009039 [Sphagnurus paluster]|uniref:Protein-S-isoprenylcysteine O-methyltransferase n=1 Tax=Sphagnurus paluster TaxID=117069 RepID=A0A9P7KL75_9AGAR|nr:hypothetical protein H0H81_009039 [Sphagnurus paluster]
MPTHTESFLRIILILAITTVIHAAHTSPVSSRFTVTDATSARAGNKEFDQYIRIIGWLKAFYWTIAVAEILTIMLPRLWNIILTSNIDTNPTLDLPLRTSLMSAIGAFLILSAGLLRWWCFKALHKYHTFYICIVEDHQLITTGPYSVVRHPSYTAVILMTVGMMCWYFAPGSLVVESGMMGTVLGKIVVAAYITAIVRQVIAFKDRIPEEDAMLRDAFGKEWDEWAKVVPYSLVPGLY